jgi:hypothetical protein
MFPEMPSAPEIKVKAFANEAAGRDLSNEKKKSS